MVYHQVSWSGDEIKINAHFDQQHVHVESQDRILRHVRVQLKKIITVNIAMPWTTLGACTYIQGVYALLKLCSLLTCLLHFGV
jgi:hypothetical protein